MFELDETQRTIEQVIRAFAAREIEPNRQALESGAMLPYPILRKLAATLGLAEQLREAYRRRSAVKGKTTGVAPPPGAAEASSGKDRPGGGLDPMIPAILFKEISRVSPGVCMSLLANLGCATAIATRGDQAQRDRWAWLVYGVEKVGCWALTEPSSGSDAFGAMRTRARVDGDGFLLRGSKTFISNAPHADVLVLFARLERAGESGPVRAFVLERGDAGLSTGPPMPKMGMWDSPTGEIFLDDVRVGRDRLLGPAPGEALGQEGRGEARETLQYERAVMPAMCLGIIERCLEESVRYAGERETFGRKIGQYQLIQQRLARMYVALENTRNLVFKLAWLQREGRLDDKTASAAKLYASEQAVEVALSAIQVMGGAGYMRQAPVEKLMRDAKMLEIGGGTTEIQILTLARALLREVGVEFAGVGSSI